VTKQFPQHGFLHAEGSLCPAHNSSWRPEMRRRACRGARSMHEGSSAGRGVAAQGYVAVRGR
jgi:hypothetical protein